MTKADRRCIAIARFAERHGVPVEWALRLSRLAHAAHRAGERACSYDVPGLEEKNDRAQARVEKHAAEQGFGVQWPGLWPVLVKDNQTIHIPE